ncbi:MAG: flagellar M-ring protein FliF [Proteobacteria bacterium]|nr:flagellar M-ring protein FliF [Pseudomonadota bacterium]
MNAEVAHLPAPAPGWQATLKPLLLLVGIAMAVAAGVTVVLWSRGPTYTTLYANLGTQDQAQITQALDAAQIPYRMAPGSSTIEVPAEKLNDARLKLAGQGLPEGGGGFAMMDKDPGFGVSQFMENARYQHALEAELARTIAALRPVEAARVHLAVPRASAFVRDHKGASASVFLQLKQGRRLEQEQIQAIVNLVASSIPDLEANQVTVVDQQGRLLSSPEGHDQFAMREQQYDMIHRLEDDYGQRIEALLVPLVGPGRVHAQVVAQMDMAVTEEAHEQYKPDSQIVRSEQTSESVTKDASGTQGVPGALTNQPPPAGVAQPPPPNTPAKPANGAPAAAGAAAATSPVGATTGVPATESTSKQATKNYEIDRTVAYTKQPAGRLRRVTVAVLIDNLRTVSKDGKTHETPLSKEQLDHINQLVKDAVGYDEARGDSVNVVNASFTQDATPAPDGELITPKIWETPLFLDIAKVVGGLVVCLVLVLSVIRPLVKNLIAPAAQQMQVQVLPKQAAAGAAGALGADAETATNTPALPSAAQLAAATHEQQVQQARTLVTQDPKRVAQVVRGWVAQDD